MKQTVIRINMNIVCVLDVKKVAYELFCLFAKLGALQADNDSCNPPKNVHKNVFIAESFD